MTGDASDEELDTRERLVRAAVEVFLEKGYGGARVQDIARKAGYTAGALYVHFPSRAALLGEAIVLEGQSIIDSLITRFTVTPGDGTVSRALAEFAAADSGPLDILLLEALALASRDTDARQMLQDALDKLEAGVRSQVEAGMSMGLLDPSLGVDAVRSFFSSWVLGTVMHRALGLGHASTDALYAVAERVTGALMPK